MFSAVDFCLGVFVCTSHPPGRRDVRRHDRRPNPSTRCRGRRRSLGRNHLRGLRGLETEGAGDEPVAAVEPDAARADEAAKQYGIPVFARIDALLKADLKLDAACVAVPTVKHYEVASQLLDAGLDLLIEKPLARLFPKPTR